MSSLLRLVVGALLIGSLAWPGGEPRAQYHGTFSPYDGGAQPLNVAKFVYGKTPPEVCSQRSAGEIINWNWNIGTAILHIGWLAPGTPGGATNGCCGVTWMNKLEGGQVAVISNCTLAINPVSCGDFSQMAVSHPGVDVPVPQECAQPCPPNQRDANGQCWLFGGGGGGGGGCPECGNPLNPATGNKFQAEVDIAPAFPGGLSLTRYYNTGRAVPLTHDHGGFWQHTYSIKIVDIDTGKAAAYRNDGKVNPFDLVSGVWTPRADIADALVELKDASGRRTGWKYTVAANDAVETYDSGGTPLSIRNRAGLTTTFVYADGTNGSTTGNGGVFVDLQGNPTTTPMHKGMLLRVQDAFGRAITFGYGSPSLRILKVTDPAGGAIIYGYGPHRNLVSVRYPDGKQRQYLYNEPAHTGGANFRYNLTGIVDENGTRFATYQYDQNGRATKSTHHAGGNEVNRYAVAYDVSGQQSTITDPRGTSRPNGYQAVHGRLRGTGEAQPSASGSGNASTATTYDSNGNIASYTDFNGNRTNYTYDLARNLEISRTEGLTASGGTTPLTRTITTQWHPVFRLPTEIVEPLRTTTNVYDAATGNLLSKTIQPSVGAARTWTYTYNANGDVLSVDGPRTDVSDVTTHTYYPNNDPDVGKRGRLATTTNAAGHTVSITAYNAHGQPLTMVDANGLTTTMTYDARQRLKTRSVGGETTTYDYDGVGNLTKTTLPDGSFLENTYDQAHRLTQVEDSLGNRIVYTLDAMGNRTQEQVFDPASQLAQTRSRVYNDLNRLFRELGAQSQTTEYGYDEQGNVVSVKDPLNRVTVSQYDAFNRLKQVTSPAPVSAVTQYAYNGLDALTQVTDPRGLVTGYAVDGLGNLTQQTSPDTGVTAKTYDAAGNVLSQTDAKGQLTSYAYDLLNRVTLITFHDGSKQAYAYDQGANGIGRLSSITETDPANQATSVIAYAYDPHGRVTSETRTVAGAQHVLGYRYDAAGRLDRLTYPSGRTVDYAFDALGRVSAITTTKPGEQAQNVVTGVAYHPFGGVKGYTLGNGQAYTRGIDQDGRIASYTLGGQTFAIGYDAASRIEFISDVGAPANTNTYGYDALDRLTSAVLPSTPYAYGYDAVGNRTSKTSGASTETYTYSPSSNRIATAGSRSFVFDANGSTTSDGANTFAYDVRGRMASATSSLGTTSYQVNALGQRIRKTNSLGDTVFHYDTQGKLIAETGPGGSLKRELIYLGDIPVGVIQ